MENCVDNVIENEETKGNSEYTWIYRKTVRATYSACETLYEDKILLVESVAKTK